MIFYYIALTALVLFSHYLWYKEGKCRGWCKGYAKGAEDGRMTWQQLRASYDKPTKGQP